MEVAHAAYLAGLFDGEGSFDIERFKRPAHLIGFQYREIATLTMCDEKTIGFVASITGRKVRSYRIKSGRTAHKIDWRNAAACDFIRSILPFLLGKRKEADRLLEFHEKVAPGRGRPYKEEDLERCEFY